MANISKFLLRCQELLNRWGGQVHKKRRSDNVTSVTKDKQSNKCVFPTTSSSVGCIAWSILLFVHMCGQVQKLSKGLVSTFIEVFFLLWLLVDITRLLCHGIIFAAKSAWLLKIFARRYVQSESIHLEIIQYQLPYIQKVPSQKHKPQLCFPQALPQFCVLCCLCTLELSSVGVATGCLQACQTQALHKKKKNYICLSTHNLWKQLLCNLQWKETTTVCSFACNPRFYKHKE